MLPVYQILLLECPVCALNHVNDVQHFFHWVCSAVFNDGKVETCLSKFLLRDHLSLFGDPEVVTVVTIDRFHCIGKS